MRPRVQSLINPYSIALAFCLAIICWNGFSDEHRDADLPHRIAVATLDVAKVFKQYRSFNERMNHLKSKVEEFDREIVYRQEQLNKRTPMNSGPSQEVADDEKKAEYLKAAILVDVAAKKKEFLLLEARAYAEKLQSIENVVMQICRKRDIGIVVRTSGDAIVPSDRSSVLQAVNRPIVYSAVPDLTDDVISELNR